MQLETFFDPATFTLTYLVYDPKTLDAVLIDPVLDFDPLAAQTSTPSVEKIAERIRQLELKLHWVLETHAHADHLSASVWLKQKFHCKVAIGSRITEVQETFKGIFDADFSTDGRQFDRLLKDGEIFSAGSLDIEVLATPGHTPACVTYKIEDAIFTGDALFMEDYGTGRCDFPRGSAADLYHSVHDRLYHLPDNTRVFVGHDYQPGGRELRYETTIGRSKQENIQLRTQTSKEEFVAFRTQRDARLAPPRLLFPSVQVNANAGHLPSPHKNGKRYLTIPLNLFHPTGDDGAILPPER